VKINPDFEERAEGDDLLLRNLTGRATLLIPAKKVRGYRAIRAGRPHDLEPSDIDTLRKYEVITDDTLSPPISKRRTLAEKLDDPKYLYDNYTKQFYPHKAPLGVLWSVTQRCNLCCQYCHASARKTAVDRSLKDIIIIADKLIAARPFEIVINGGEPFLRRDLFSIIEHLMGHKFILSINTNGTLIDKRTAARLADLSTIVGVSIDGPNEEINSLTRGRFTLEKSVLGIRRLAEAGVTTHILTTVTRLNFDSIRDIVALTASLGVKIQTLQDLHPAGFGKQVFHDLALTPTQEENILPLLRDLSRDFPDMTINTTELTYFAYHEIAEKHTPADRPPLHLFQCTACTESLYIDASGTLYPCVALLDMPMGNLLTEDFSACWQNSLAARMVREARGISVTAIAACRDCVRNHICTGGCRGDAISLYDDWFAPHPRCPKCVNERSAIVNGPGS
jgi:radical SAM protein with 4Fe4S-binding SPASM domain